MATGGGEQSKYSDSFSSEDLDDLKCQPCHEEGIIQNAVGICLDCQEYLCQRCYDGHTLPKPSRHHQLLDQKQMSKSKIQLQRKDKCTQKCPQHDDEVVKYYCTEHSQLGCGVCLSLDHRTCKVQYIPDAAKDIDRNKELKQVQEWLQIAQQRSQHMVDATAQSTKLIDSSCAEALSKMEKHGSEVNAAHDSIQNDLIKKAKAAKLKGGGENLNEVTEKHRGLQRELRTMQTRVVTLQATSQNCNLYTEIMKIRARIKPLEAEINQAESDILKETTEIVFTPNQEYLDMLKSPLTFGQLSVSEKLNIVNAERFKDINVASSTNTKTGSITGSILLSDSRLVIADHNNKCIKTVDVEQNKVTAQFTFQSPPFDVCKINDKEVAVTLPEETNIAFVKIDGGMRIDRTIQIDGKCRGIDFKEGNLAVTFRDPGSVQVLNLQGKVLHNIATDKTGKALFSMRPLYVTFDKYTTNIYVSDYDRKCVLYLKLDGTTMASYTDSNLFYPRKSAFDSSGKLYICGYDNVHQVSHDRKKIRVLLNNGLDAPQTISYSGVENKLYVGMHNSNIIKVFRGIAHMIEL